MWLGCARQPVRVALFDGSRDSPEGCHVTAGETPLVAAQGADVVVSGCYGYPRTALGHNVGSFQRAEGGFDVVSHRGFPLWRHSSLRKRRVGDPFYLMGSWSHDGLGP